MKKKLLNQQTAKINLLCIASVKLLRHFSFFHVWTLTRSRDGLSVVDCLHIADVVIASFVAFNCYTDDWFHAVAMPATIMLKFPDAQALLRYCSIAVRRHLTKKKRKPISIYCLRWQIFLHSAIVCRRVNRSVILHTLFLRSNALAK